MRLRLPILKYSDLYRKLLVFLGLNVPIVFLLLLRNLRQVDFTPLTWIYLFCVTLGYYTLALLLVITLIFIFSLSWRTLAAGCAGAVLVIFIFYLLIDGQTYSLTSLHINLFWLEWIISDYQGLGLPDSTIPFALLALLFVIALEWGIFKLVLKVPQPRFLAISLWLLVIVSFSASQIIHIVTYERNDIRVTSLTPHLPAYVPLTSHNIAIKYGDLIPLDEEEPVVVPNEFTGSFNYPSSEIKLVVTNDKMVPNIVVIFLESWRYDMMNESVTPKILEFSRKSAVSSKHFCTGNSTVAGTFGFFYGINPTYWTAVSSNNLLIDNPVFIDVLKDYGYTFGVFAKSNFKRHKLKDSIFRGIDVHEEFDGATILEQDQDLTNQFKSFLLEQKNNSTPFFGFAFFKSNHAPYWYPPQDSIFLPAGDQNLMLASSETDPTSYLNDYRNATHYVDRLTGEILRQIEALGFLSNTIVIITSEHGEEFNDNKTNFWGHGSNFTQFQTMVPLIFYAPGKKPTEINFPTSHVDIAPTILQEFLHCTNDIRDYSNGLNLFAGQSEPRAFVIGSYVNYAFVIDDNVYEIFPLYTKDYKLHNIAITAARPSSQMLKKIVEETGRFFKNGGRSPVISSVP